MKARKAPITGEQITPTAAKASSSHSEAAVQYIIDCSGLADKDKDGLLEHNTNLQNMWLSEKGQTSGWVEFDLGKGHKLGTICVWNLNERWLTKRGLKRADISVWTEKAGWKKVLDDFEFDEAEGKDDYDEPVLVKLDGIEAQKVRLDDLVNLGDTEHVGLSEVQFFKIQGPRAVKPQPANGQKNVKLRGFELKWMPGLDAVAHNVYLGTDPNQLKLLGEVKDASSAKLSPLAGNTKYYWRIDEVQADGSMVK
ncbi:MAG: discoidin domain-containing protein, partial [Phycisphaerae bacterium]